MVWAPAEGVSDFFFVTRWVPGQIGSEYQETALHQQKEGAWTVRKLPNPIERILDAADHGNIYVAAALDGGCCGAANESDDTTSVVRGDRVTVIFDERTRFHNYNYDVSFFTTSARLSPDVSRIAYTIANTTLQPGEEIRLASEGKPNPAELTAIQKAITELPRVEVVALSQPSRVLVELAKTELIAWLDQQRLLVLTKGELHTVEVDSGKMAPTGIKADASSFVFLR